MDSMRGELDRVDNICLSQGTKHLLGIGKCRPFHCQQLWPIGTRPAVSKKRIPLESSAICEAFPMGNLTYNTFRGGLDGDIQSNKASCQPCSAPSL